MSKFATPKQLIKYTGLSISVKKSGMYESRQNHFNKVGNRYLRFIVMVMARSLSRCHPDFVGKTIPTSLKEDVSVEIMEVDGVDRVVIK